MFSYFSCGCFRLQSVPLLGKVKAHTEAHNTVSLELLALHNKDICHCMYILSKLAFVCTFPLDASHLLLVAFACLNNLLLSCFWEMNIAQRRALCGSLTCAGWCSMHTDSSLQLIKLFKFSYWVVDSVCVFKWMTSSVVIFQLNTKTIINPITIMSKWKLKNTLTV